MSRSIGTNPVSATKYAGNSTTKVQQPKKPDSTTMIQPPKSTGFNNLGSKTKKGEFNNQKIQQPRLQQVRKPDSTTKGGWVGRGGRLIAYGFHFHLHCLDPGRG